MSKVGTLYTKTERSTLDNKSMCLTGLLPGPPRWPSGNASASRAEDPGLESRLRRDFSGSSHNSDLKIGTPVAILPGAWHYRVSTGTGRLGVSIL